MSNLRSSDDQAEDLISKLQLLLHELHTIQASNMDQETEASKVLEDTCNVIKRLHRQVDELSNRLFQLLPTTDDTSDQAALIRSLLMQSTTF